MRPVISTKTSGFTLFEFSIVVTVISLIIGGILAGQAMIQNAKLQSVMADIDAFTKAAQTFRDKYNYLPGDLPTAETFWGSMTGCPTPAYSAIASQKTCNGDGNGHIGDHWVGLTHDYEMFTMWQQLSDSGLIKGTFSGMSTASSFYDGLPGINIPKSVYENGGYMLLFVQPQNFAADPNYFAADYGHMIAFGSNSANNLTQQALITPEEASIIDSKIDDGLPAEGKVLAGKSALMANCTTSDTASLSRYNIAYKGRACGLFFITGL